MPTNTTLITTGDGARIAYRWDGDAGLPVLALSNSIGTTLRMWDDLVPALARHFRVLRFDTRGPVSYTHLDVYKRQPPNTTTMNESTMYSWPVPGLVEPIMVKTHPAIPARPEPSAKMCIRDSDEGA